MNIFKETNKGLLVGVVLILIILPLLLACSTAASSTTAKPAASQTVQPSTTSAPSNLAITSTPAKPSAAATTTPAQQSQTWPNLDIGTSGLQGSLYPIAVGWAELMKKYAGIKATPMVTGGSAPNGALLGQNKIQLALITTDIMIDAYAGTGLFNTGKVPMTGIMRGHERIYQLIARADSNIKTPADIKGKRFMYYQPSGPCQIMYGDNLMAAYNIKPSEFTRQDFKDTAGACSALKEGLTDVIMSGACPNAAVMELSQTTKIRFIPISLEAQKFICDKLSTFEPSAVPKDVYGAGLPAENLPSVKDRTWMVARADLSNDLIYEATKAVLDHPDEFGKFTPLCPEYKLDGANKNPVIPFHPGAIKYYKEKGVWTAADDKMQASLTK
jgi:TRAP transporter TAXI family solute receptor